MTIFAPFDLLTFPDTYMGIDFVEIFVFTLHQDNNIVIDGGET